MNLDRFSLEVFKEIGSVGLVETASGRLSTDINFLLNIFFSCFEFDMTP